MARDEHHQHVRDKVTKCWKGSMLFDVLPILMHTYTSENNKDETNLQEIWITVVISLLADPPFTSKTQRMRLLWISPGMARRPSSRTKGQGWWRAADIQGNEYISFLICFPGAICEVALKSVWEILCIRIESCSERLEPNMMSQVFEIKDNGICNYFTLYITIDLLSKYRFI